MANNPVAKDNDGTDDIAKSYLGHRRCLAACGVVLIGKFYAVGPVINPVVWLETIAILTFATSCMVKSDAIQGVIGLVRKRL